MLHRTASILAALVSLAAGIEHDPRPEPPLWSAIRVQDVLTGRPVVGARLRALGGARLVAPSTGADGVTHCSHRVSPNTIIFAEGAGYQIGMCWVTQVTRDSFFAAARLKRAADRTILGSVVNGQSGRSLRDVAVRVGNSEARTDFLGRFVLRGVCNAGADIKAAHPKLPYQLCSFTAGEGDTVIAHISMYGSSATGILFGTVTDTATGRPVAGATISIHETEFTIGTDRNGDYEFRRVPPGEYLVEVGHPSYFAKRIHTVTLTPTPPVRVDWAVHRRPGR